MPSMDRIGRYYPLLIAAPLAPDWPLLTLPVSAGAWFRQAEQLALSGLDNDVLDLDDFSRRVETLGPPPTADFAVNNTPASRAWCCSLPDALDWPQTLPALATHLLTQGFVQPSLWWTEGSEWVARCLLLCEGLPPIQGFAALLAGIGENEAGAKNRSPALMVIPARRPSPERTNYEHETTLFNGHPPGVAMSAWSVRLMKMPALPCLNWACGQSPDGMGGHEAGDVASRLIVETLQQTPPPTDWPSFLNSVRERLSEVNRQLREESAQRYQHRTIGSTVVVLAAYEGQCACLWVGDSRIYRLQGEKVTCNN